jgi:hypothetical protein
LDETKGKATQQGQNKNDDEQLFEFRQQTWKIGFTWRIGCGCSLLFSASSHGGAYDGTYELNIHSIRPVSMSTISALKIKIPPHLCAVGFQGH